MWNSRGVRKALFSNGIRVSTGAVSVRGTNLLLRASNVEMDYEDGNEDNAEGIGALFEFKEKVEEFMKIEEKEDGKMMLTRTYGTENITVEFHCQV